VEYLINRRRTTSEATVSHVKGGRAKAVPTDVPTVPCRPCRPKLWWLPLPL